MTSRVNLSTNPSIEVSTANHSAVSGATLAQSSAWAQAGTKSLLITAASDGIVWNNSFIPKGDSFTITTTVGQVYTVSAYVLVTAGSYCPMQISVPSQLGSKTTATGVVQRIAVTFTASATTTTVSILSVSSTHASGDFSIWNAVSANVDAILAELAPAASSYFDGDSAGCTWSGTSGLSTSTYTSPPMTITVTSDPGNLPPRNIVYVSNATGVTAQISRLDADGATRLVRGGDPATLTGGTWVGFDYEMPYTAGNTYTVAPDDFSTPATTTAPALGITQAWLVHPGQPSLSRPVNQIQLSDEQADSGRALHSPLGRKYPIVITDGAFKSEAMQFGFRTTTDIDRSNMLALLQDTSPLLLQIVYPFTASSMWRYVSVGHYGKRRVTMQFGDDRRDWMLDVVEVDRPVGGVAAQRNWGDLMAEAATWQDVLNKYVTWTGVVTGIAGT